MATKGGLANSLLGKFVAVIWGLEHLFDLPKQFAGVPGSGFSSGGRCSSPAKIEAAWTDQGNVMLAVVDKQGRTEQMYFKNVRVFTEEASAEEYMNSYRFLTGKRDSILELLCDNPTMAAEDRKKLTDQVTDLERQLRSL